MLTSTGKFLRKIRIDQGEILKDMADKLNVTVSFLSAVENGKKKMPSSWNNKVCELYRLSKTQSEEFFNAIAETEKSVEIDFDGVTNEKREIAVAFARKFAEIDLDRLIEIKKILQKGDN